MPACLRPVRPLLTLALSAAIALGVVACGGSSSHRASLPAARGAPLLSIFEAESELHADPPAALATLRGLGADTVRVFIPWASLGSQGGIAPDPTSSTRPPGLNLSDPAAYPAANWAVFDHIMIAARDSGMRVDLTVGGVPPLWARGAGDPGHPVHPQWRPDATAFQQFVRAVGRRYSGSYRPAGATAALPRVEMWGIWNEPNFGPSLAPQVDPSSGQDASPSIYRGLLDAAWAGLQASGHGRDLILIGELAPRGTSLGRGPGAFGYMVPLRFLRGLYCVNASLAPLRGAAAAALGCPSAGSPSAFRAAHPGLFDAGGFAVHPYEFSAPDVPAPGEPDYVDLSTLPRFESTLDHVMQAYESSRRFPIYSTEFGFETNPPETVIGTVTPALAAAYLNQSEYISWRDPRVRSYDQYLLTDPAAGVFATGLRFADGRAKPGLAAYRMPLWLPRQSFAHGRAIEVWGRVRPARYATVAGRSQVAVIQFRAAGSGSFRDIARVRLSAPNFTFDVAQAFPGSGVVRVAWTPPGHPASFSRTVTISSR